SVRLAKEAARAVKSGRSILVAQESLDQSAGVLVVDDCDDELHGGSIGGASVCGGTRTACKPSGQRGGQPARSRPTTNTLEWALAKSAVWCAESGSSGTYNAPTTRADIRRLACPFSDSNLSVSSRSSATVP